MYLIKKPYNISHEFAQRLESLASNMQVLKLPKSTAREFFNEIAEGAICICGRCIGEKERENILNNADHYLGQEELVALNAIKGSLKEIKVTNELIFVLNLILYFLLFDTFLIIPSYFLMYFSQYHVLALSLLIYRPHLSSHQIY